MPGKRDRAAAGRDDPSGESGTACGGRHGCACAEIDAVGRRLVDRRRFLTATAFASVTALLAAACGDGEFPMTAPDVAALPPGGLRLRVADYSALSQVGGIARVDGGQGTPIAVVRSGAQSFAAYSLVCPHQGTTVNIQGGGFVCPNHGARFSASGAWTGGQPTSGLLRYDATYDAVSGVLTISGGATPRVAPTAASATLVVRLADFPALASSGGIARVDGGQGAPVALVRTGAGTVVALSLACPHAGTTVNVSGAGFLCPNHGARFNAGGAWIGGQPTTALVVLASTYDAAAGTVTIHAPTGARTAGGDDDGETGDHRERGGDRDDG